jgi:CRISPR-associated protein Csm1
MLGHRCRRGQRPAGPQRLGRGQVLLVQGDFFGIQDFIFADGAETNRSAARLLRGRSFQVSLFSELAALRVLEACGLPSTSQITNAAGKFLIVAPNTADVRAALAALRAELDAWFLTHGFGQAGIGLVTRPASCNDFLKGRFRSLIEALFADLEEAKLQRFDLTGAAPAVLNADYPHGACPFNGRLPPTARRRALSRDQIALGTQLARQDRLLIARDAAALHSGGLRQLEMPCRLPRRLHRRRRPQRPLRRARAPGAARPLLGFQPPRNPRRPLWHGYARRYINAYVPLFRDVDLVTAGKYAGTAADEDDAPTPARARPSTTSPAKTAARAR